MISWVGLLGKIFGFLAQEIGKKAINKKTDKRDLACQALTRLYFNLTHLEGTAKKIHEAALISIEDEERPATFSCEVHNNRKEIESLSLEFYDSSRVLMEALEVFAPEVVEALYSVFSWKGSILWEASRSFVVESSEGTYDMNKLRYQKPKDKILEMDLDQHMDWVRNHPGDVDWESVEWPQTLLMGCETDGSFDEVVIELTNKDDLKEFADLLGKHIAVLSDAKSKMRELLKDSFSLEDVLFQKWTENKSW